MRAPPPKAKGVVTIEQIVETLPDRGRSCWHLGAVWALSQFQENEVRPRANAHLHTPNAPHPKCFRAGKAWEPADAALPSASRGRSSHTAAFPRSRANCGVPEKQTNVSEFPNTEVAACVHPAQPEAQLRVLALGCLPCESTLVLGCSQPPQPRTLLLLLL